MERKQGFFSALKEEVVRGLSPGRSRAKSPARSASPMSRLLRRSRKPHHAVDREIREPEAGGGLVAVEGGARRDRRRRFEDGGEVGPVDEEGTALAGPFRLLLCCLQTLGSEALARSLGCAARPGAR